MAGDSNPRGPMQRSSDLSINDNTVAYKRKRIEANHPPTLCARRPHRDKGPGELETSYCYPRSILSLLEIRTDGFIEHVFRWWRTSGQVNPRGGLCDNSGGSREERERDSSTVTPWPRDDPEEMFALVAVLCAVATGGCMKVQEEEEEGDEEEEGKGKEQEGGRGEWGERGSRKSSERSKKSTRWWGGARGREGGRRVLIQRLASEGARSGARW